MIDRLAPRRRALATVVAALAVLLAGTALVGCTSPAEPSVPRLRVGQCFDDDRGDAASVEEPRVLDEIPPVDCTQPHDNQVYATFELPGGGRYPGREAALRDGAEGCRDRFADVFGVPSGSADSELDALPLVPTERGWERADDRTVICAAFRRDGEPITGSVLPASGAIPGGEGEAGGEGDGAGRTPIADPLGSTTTSG